MQSTILPKLMNKRHQLALRQWQTAIKAYKKKEKKKRRTNKTKTRLKVWKQHQILHLQTRLVQLKSGGIPFTKDTFIFPGWLSTAWLKATDILIGTSKMLLIHWEVGNMTALQWFHRHNPACYKDISNTDSFLTPLCTVLEQTAQSL